MDFNESNEPTGLIGTVHDITEQRQAEAVLKESEAKYKNIVNNSNDIIATADKSGNWTFLSPSVKKILGYYPAEMVGRSAFDFMFSEDIVSTQKAHETVVKEGRYFWKYENRWISKDSRIITLAWNVVVFKDEEDNIIGTQAVGRDITDLKQAEEALRTSNRLLEILAGKDDIIPMLRESVSELKNFTGCAAVGIRLLDAEGNIPYQAYDGFSHVFYELESPLSIKSDKCMCINVIKGTFDSKLPFYTEGGSFYMNGTTKCLASVFQEEKGETRNTCNEAGYESVALVPIRVNGQIVGLFHVADSKENMVPLHMVEVLEGFGRQLGSVILRIQAQEALKNQEKDLRRKSKRIEEINTALNVMLKKRDEDKLLIEEKVLFNVKELIEPLIENLQNSGLDENQTGYVNILESFLSDIVSPFSQTLHTKFLGLTLSEIRVANLIKEGKTTKEIAGLLNSTPRAIGFHRQNIRKKLGLSNRKANLGSHLLSLLR